MQHEMLLLKIYYLQMILGNLLLQIVVHLKEFPIVQWGTCINGDNIYPISFSKFCTLSIGGEHPYSGGGSFLPEKPSSLSGFYYKLTVDTYYGGYIAIGV